MPQPSRRLVNVVVKEVSLVGAGDNPGAQVVLFKAREQPRTLRQRWTEKLAALRQRMGREPGAEVRKRLYDEVREQQQASQVYEALGCRLNALAQSLESIVWWPTEEEQQRPKDELIRETVRQFADGIERDA